ncbi:MAG: carbamoyltransferase HypF [Oscillospiraceae bacterium]|nr:carbamoyltransferase HypF [Oscillospiraceae bacterium]
MKTVNIHVYGIVQGVGFRPFTANAARRHDICGTASNKGSYVEIIAYGSENDLAAFTDTLRYSPPERAVVLSVDVKELPLRAYDDFRIIESEREYGDIFVSPDIAICEKCSKELLDPHDRRYLHPFINCTQCGPRLTILDNMPYDRERTSMKGFPMCSICAREYTDHMSRRYDAQPVCCNDCGPQVYIIGTELRGLDAVSYVRKAIAEGKIAAIKGIGGFHLCCDARNDEAVLRLRKLKSRPMKPFAVMMRDMDTVRRECKVTPEEEALLTGWQKPIVLLERLGLSEHIAPDNPTIGVMLPYSPIHMLLFDLPDTYSISDALVMTSANVKGAPICRTDEDALREISSFCDVIMSHNRDILIRADDSVTQVLDGKPYMIRRSRGYAPLPIMTDKTDRIVLGIGGELKNTFCIGKYGLLYPSPYVGDMEDIRTADALLSASERMCRLLEAQPDTLICDKHPGYNTTAIAEDMAHKLGVPLIKVQHHYAHVLSCMAENRRYDPVIGVSFDGTGYGDDGTIWGGEVFVCDIREYRRVSHIAQFRQVGGDLASREGWRIAASLLSDMPDGKGLCTKLGLCDEKAFTLIEMMKSRGINTAVSTSCGRLFDAVSAILGIRRASTFEGEASTALMFAAEKGSASDVYPGRLSDTSALVREIALRASDGDNIYDLAMMFHASLADMITEECIAARDSFGINTAALTGGVFQNRLLVRLTRDKLEKSGFDVLLHSQIPPNDGGICVGQALYGLFT